jgi:hypothetical protein
MVNIPDFLLTPLIEAAYSIIKELSDEDMPTNLRRMSHFDAKSLTNPGARAQILQSLSSNQEFAARVEDEFFARVEVNVAFQQWQTDDKARLITDAATRNDLPLIASMLWLKRPEHYEYGLGLIVGHGQVSMEERERDDAQRADEMRLTHAENAAKREKERADLLVSDVERLEGELRDERQARRVSEQRYEAKLAAAQKQIEQNDEVVQRITEARDRQTQRVEREASRASELEARLRNTQEESSKKSAKISQLQEQLASSLSSDVQLTYDDLQSLVTAQKDAEAISRSMLTIMNKTRTILSAAVPEETATIKSDHTAEIKAVQPVLQRDSVEVPPGMEMDSDSTLRTVLVQDNLVVIVDGTLAKNDTQRDAITSTLTQIESRFHPTCVAIFDGESATARGRIHSNVHIVYAPAGLAVGDVIVERIKVTPPERPIIVVSDNESLVSRVDSLGCTVMMPDQFKKAADL